MISDEDIQLALSVAPDTSEIDAALQEIAQRVDAAGRQAGKALIAGMSEAGKAQADRQRIDLMFKSLGAPARPAAPGFDPVATAHARLARERETSQAQAAYENITQGPGQALPVPPKVELAKGEGPLNFGAALRAIQREGLGKGLGGILGGEFGGQFDKSSILGTLIGGLGQGGAQGLFGAAAGGLGAAAGGPMGALIAEAPKLLDVMGSKLATPMKMAVAGFKELGSALHTLEGPIGPLALGFDLLSTGMDKMGGMLKSIPVVGQLVGPLMDALGQMPAIFKDMITTLLGFTSKASPGLFKQFQVALEDVQGVIGQAFLPLLYASRDAVREFADTLKALLETEEVRTAIGGLAYGIREMGSVTAELLKAIGPDGLAAAITFVTGNIRLMSLALRSAATALSLFMTPVRFLLGIKAPGVTPGASYGAAAQPARIEGIEEYQKRLQESAYGQPGQDVSDLLKGTNQTLLEIYKLLSAGIGVRILQGIFGQPAGYATRDTPASLTPRGVMGAILHMPGY